MSLEETLQDPVALRRYVDGEIARLQVVAWLREREERKIAVSAYGVRGVPTALDFLTPGWQKAYFEMVWTRGR